MPIPDYQTVMRPLLVEISDGGVHDLVDVRERLYEVFALSDAERQQMIPSGKSTVIRSRVGWARTYLKKAGLITQPRKRHVQITELGLQALKDCPERLDNQYLKQFESFRVFTGKAKTAVQIAPASIDDPVNLDLANLALENLDPEEQLQQAWRKLNQSLASDLLDQIKDCTPQFFEKLVVDLMLAMGYGGTHEDAGQATQFSNDGGIDGIIKQDPLGLDTIYLQAKRYTDNTIGRPEVQKFAGALDMQRAKKGVFITTSQFSRDALEFVELIEKKIILIDGDKLADLMITYNLGTSVKETFTLKAVDTDYFLED